MRILLLAGALALGACQPDRAPSPGDGGAANETVPDKDAPLDAVVDPASVGSAAEVAAQYAEAVSAGRLGEAYGLLAPGSEAAGDGAASFVEHFRGRRQVVMTIGKPGDPVAGDGMHMLAVPAVLSGADESGMPFRVEGPVLLRVVDKAGSPDAAPSWQIVSAPFPAAPEQAGSQ